MPKVIENLQVRILACARVLLLEQGIDGLNIRAVASACGVAVGMVYNYYGSKDQLIASIMLQDWLQNMREAVGEVNAAASPSQGMRAICRGIDRFAGTAGAEVEGRSSADAILGLVPRTEETGKWILHVVLQSYRPEPVFLSWHPLQSGSQFV